MPFWKCYYHIVWATKEREPVITAQIEPILFDSIRYKAQELGCAVLAINGISDHVHAAVSIPPTLTIADWIKHIKGVSSRAINEGQTETAARFRWQRGYGVLTVGERHLPMVLEYIVHQKEHHSKGTLYAALEHTCE